jgi:flagellar basal-body rod protein FlgG
MFRSLFISATGMEAQKLNIDVISNNLANVNTTGYKKSRADFQELMYQDLKSPGSMSSEVTMVPSGIQVGLGVKAAAVQKVFSQGDLVNTGNGLDIAVEGDGFFQILMPDGALAYTRSGSFKLNSEGGFVNSDGFELDPSISVPPDAMNITISSGGQVSASIPGSDQLALLGNIELARFANPGGLNPIGRNLYLPTASSGEAMLGSPGSEGLGTVSQGFVELSNVNVVEEMINMIVSQRAYEISSKAVQSADEMLQLANNLRR